MPSASESQFLVFIHGVGGACPTEQWLSPLSNVMAQLGHSRPESSGIDIITVDYRAALLDPAPGKLPGETWRSRAGAETAYDAFQIRRAEVERILTTYRSDPPTLHLGHVDGMTATRLASLVEQALRTLRLEARRYRTDATARASVLRQVLAQLPSAGHGVILAHSLGSVVAADLVKRLPPEVTVDQLVTLGSPLPLTQFWPFLTIRGAGFPYGRLGSWVNVFDFLDPVTNGRGIGQAHREALDAPVHVGALASLVSNHAAQTYLSLPVVGEVVGEALFGGSARFASSRSPASSAHLRGRAWDLYLLGAAYAMQVSMTCDPKKHKWRRRFDAARRASVVKLLTAAEQQSEQFSGTDAHPLPAEADLLDHAAALVRGTWSDDELLPFAVALLMSSPVRPFQIPVAERHAQEALAAVLDRVRVEGSNIADPVFARRVAESLEDAKDAMGGSSIWPYLMLGGAAVLAATGIGVWAAMPTGVAGAALLTSTMAAFGPGGMVGGMVTIAAASGAGSALLGAGLAGVPEETSASFVTFARSLALLPVDQLRSTVTAMIAVLVAQRTLNLASTVEQARSVLSTALVHVANEENAHTALGSEGAREWTGKRKHLEKAIKVIDERFPSPVRSQALVALGKADAAVKVEPDRISELLSAGPDQLTTGR